MTARECTVMNFDDRTRIIHDSKQRPVAIAIGEIKTAELDMALVDFLTKAMEKNDPLIILEKRPDLPPQIEEVFSLMRELNDGAYDQLLERSIAIVGPGAFDDTRPSRAEIRHKLRFVAQRFAYSGAIPPAKELAAKPKPLPVQDDVDPDQLDDDLRKQKEAEQRSARDKKPRQQAPALTPAQAQMNDALGIAGTGVAGLAEALGQNAAAGDEDSFDAASGRPERPTRQSQAKKAAAAKKGQTSPAAGKKSAAKAPAAKKSVKRYRS